MLDEPTNGLDPSGREEMLSLVRRLSSDLGIAVLLSSHVLEDVTRTCDAVVVLRDGRLVTAGRIDEMDAACTATGVLVRAVGDLAAFTAALEAPRPARRAARRPAARDAGPREEDDPATACATRPPTPAWACASCARPGPRWRTPWWTRSSEHALRRRRDPRCPLRRATRASAAAAWPASLSLARWGGLRSLGARRGWKAKAVPITLALLAVAPAVIVLGVRALFARADRHRPDRRAAVRGLPGDHRHRDPAVRGDHHAPSCSARTAATAPSRSTSRPP